MTSPKSHPKDNKAKLPSPLKSGDVYAGCSPDQFSFGTTKDLDISYEIYSQERAVRAINMGLGIDSLGYNIYVAGIDGTGKTSVMNSFLQKWSEKRPRPNDWIYIYNFQEVESPLALPLPSGEGKKLKKKMEKLVKVLKREIPLALQSEDYENTLNAFYSAANETKSKMYNDLEKKAKSQDFIIKSTKVGIETIPVIDGLPLSEKDYSKLKEEQRDDIEQRRSELEPEVLDFARKVRKLDKETRQQAEDLRASIGEKLVSNIVEDLIDEYQKNHQLVKYLKNIISDIKENLLDFVEDEDKDEPDAFLYNDENEKFNKYRINVLVDNSQKQRAPVVIENNPTYYNLFGKIEKNVEHGMYLTDFTMIKPGAIHRANGGYLVLNVLDIFRTGHIWETLKRVLKNQKAYIEDMGEQYSLLPTSGLRPEPIPLDLKVILIGTDDIYHILYHEDEEFQKIFKIKADFDYKMTKIPENIDNYVSFIATRAAKEGLLPFEKSAVCTIIEYGSRLVEDQEMLSTQFSKIKDLTIEASYFARERQAETVIASDVEKALQEKFYRHNLYEEDLLRAVKNGEIISSFDGEKVGCINGLAVYDYGDYSFGKVGRITCTHGVGKSGVINIERQSRLSGKVHDKGIFILSGILNSLLSRKKPHGLEASITFEQSYGLVDGDSASVAEFIAIISSLSEIPIKQNLAITGSINQHGEVQVIGGVNEKIEGFFKTYSIRSRLKEFTVLIPEKNIKNLMLHKDVRNAVKEGELKIIPIKYIWEAFKIATDHELGIHQIPFQGEYDKDTALGKIESKLKKLHRKSAKKKNHD